MDTANQFITRFAPSPTGELHKGHAYSALLAFQTAHENNGRFILRIEDIDTTRCKPEFTQGIYEDLHWLGLVWEEPVRVQSQHFADYANALEQLKNLEMLYPCFCTRKDILTEIGNAERAPHGPDGLKYPGTCKKLSRAEHLKMIGEEKPHAWRLNMDAAEAHIGAPLIWHDALAGEITTTPATLGDVVLARKDTPTSYHLSVTIDDAKQGISHIIRGQDLFQATHVHIVLQKLLKLPTPLYHHHKLLTDADGIRFAKRNKSVTLRSIREKGLSANSLKESLGFSP